MISTFFYRNPRLLILTIGVAVVAGLNALGVSPRDMIDILKTIHAAGALHAEFVIR